MDTIDVFYLHNPETQLGFLTREEFDERIRARLRALEQLVDEGKIRWYGAATWDGFRKKGALSLPRLAEIAVEEGGPEHHFRFIQLPFNLGMVEAFRTGASPRACWRRRPRLGIAAVASATLCRRASLEQMPEAVAELLPGLTNAQRAIQFTRSTPGIAVALVGMGRREHVLENLGVARGRRRSRANSISGSTSDDRDRSRRRPGAARRGARSAAQSAGGLPALAQGRRAVPLARPALLRRRLLRLLKERERPSRLLNLRHTVARIEYRLTGSAFESALVLYELARRHFPETYLNC